MFNIKYINLIECVCTYSSAHKFTSPWQNMKEVDNFNIIQGIIKIVLCSTVLNELFYITEVYI